MQTDLEPDEAVRCAADYIASARARMEQPSVADIRTRFGITTEQAIEAMRLGNALRCARAA